MTALPEDHSFAAGLLVGLLVGEGHFGGDGRQPHVTLRMHTRHRAIFDWLVENVSVGRLYGPYNHSGRSYYQWMVRGPALREQLAPFLARHLDAGIDEHADARFRDMCVRYAVHV